MAKFMKEVAEFGAPLLAEDRNLLSVAYKNVVGPLRAGWRILSQIEEAEVQKGSGYVDEIADYKSSIEAKLKTVCDEISDLINDTLIDNDGSLQGKVFYYKMNGDYARYLAEIQTGNAAARNVSASTAQEAYEKATNLAKGTSGDESMAPTHPIRLGLALNFSVFYYEIMEKAPQAIEMAQKAFDDAMAQLDEVNEAEYKDATLIMQLLKDNLTLWNEEGDHQSEKQGDMEVHDLEDD